MEKVITPNDLASMARGSNKPEDSRLPDDINDKIKLGKWLQRQGYARQTPEFDALYSQLRGDLPIENHDRYPLR